MANIDFTSIDFDDIKRDLITFIENQKDENGNKTFSDQNREGANLNLLSSLLAYITNILSFNLNQGLNENFLPTAELRTNILKIVKLLNYTPARATSSKITLDLSSITTDGSPANLLKYDKVSSGGFDFYYVGENQEVVGTTLNEVQFLEGELIVNTSAYTAIGNTDFEEFIIEDVNVGEYLSIFTSTGPGLRSNWELHDKGKNYINPELQQIYFLEEIDEGYKIKFGNDALGRHLVPGEVIGFEYLRPDTSGSSNKLVTFQFDGGGVDEDVNATYSDFIITGADTEINANFSSSAGAGTKESIEEIKFNAPRFFQSQGRVVSEEDYLAQTIVRPEVSKVAVVGGEKLVPKELGKVFISVKPETAIHPDINFTDGELDAIKDDLLEISVVTIEPIVRNADFVQLIADVKLRHTSISQSPSISNTNLAIRNFINNQNSEFGEYLEFSNLLAAIDNADPLTTSNLTTLQKFIILNSTNLVTESEDGTYNVILTKNVDTTFETKIEIVDSSTGGGTTTLQQDVDYTITYTDPVNGFATIQMIQTGLLLELTSTGNEDREVRLFFETEDEDIFLNNLQIFNIFEDNITITTEKV